MAILKLDQEPVPAGSDGKCFISVVLPSPGGETSPLRVGGECASMRELAAEVERMKRDLEEILRQGRAFFLKTPVPAGAGERGQDAAAFFSASSVVVAGDTGSAGVIPPAAAEPLEIPPQITPRLAPLADAAAGASGKRWRRLFCTRQPAEADVPGIQWELDPAG